jgi:ubiquinone/menaquinone biosynthesis C-methylase UbiE
MKYLKRFTCRILEQRASRLYKWIGNDLPQTGHVLDIGSGTGHNVQEFSKRTALSYVETDVVNMSLTARHPILFDGKNLPFKQKAFRCILLCFVLQYIPDPLAFLQEISRITAHKVIVVQSTYKGRFGQYFLKGREFVQGRFIFYVCKYLRIIPDCSCSLSPKNYFLRETLQEIFLQTGFTIESFKVKEWPGFSISRDVYVLRKNL